MSAFHHSHPVSMQQQWGVSFENPVGYLVNSAQTEQINFEKHSQIDCFLTTTNPNSLCYALPYQHIWRKVCFFPTTYTPYQCHKRIIQLLRESLPISLSMLNFSYQTQITEQAIRISLFALRKGYSLPFHSQIQIKLDCELHCLARALHFLHQCPAEPDITYLYSFKDKFFAFENDGIHFYPNIPTDKAYQLLSHEMLAEKGNTQSHLYLTALGASLWNGKALI